MTLGTDPDRLKNQFAAAGGREFVESGNPFEARSQYLANVIADDKDAPITLSASQQSKRETQLSETKKRRREEQQRIVLTLAEQARRLSKQLGNQIAAMETAFEAEMGDAWREQIANKVMDADDIPQRREGESMKDYRERLETVLIATMIDENGDVRPEYAKSDDPDVRRYADWAQGRHRQNELAKTPPEQMQEFLDANANWADTQIAEQTMHDRGIDSTVTAQRTDDLTDLASDVEAEGNFFGTSPSG